MKARSSALPRQMQSAKGSPSVAGDSPGIRKVTPPMGLAVAMGVAGGVDHQPPRVLAAVPHHPQGDGDQAAHTPGDLLSSSIGARAICRRSSRR